MKKIHDLLIVMGLVLFVIGLFLYVSTAAAVFGCAAILILSGLVLAVCEARGSEDKGRPESADSPGRPDLRGNTSD